MTPALTGLLVLLAAVTVESFAQLFLKVGAAGAAGDLRGPGRAAVNLPARAWVLLGVGAYAVEVALYSGALHYLDVSVAFPVGSLCFVGVAILSKLVLGETVGRVRWLGVGCILAGTILVAC